MGSNIVATQLEKKTSELSNSRAIFEIKFYFNGKLSDLVETLEHFC